MARPLVDHVEPPVTRLDEATHDPAHRFGVSNGDRRQDIPRAFRLVDVDVAGSHSFNNSAREPIARSLLLLASTQLARRASRSCSTRAAALSPDPDNRCA